VLGKALIRKILQLLAGKFKTAFFIFFLRNEFCFLKFFSFLKRFLFIRFHWLILMFYDETFIKQ